VTDYIYTVTTDLQNFSLNVQYTNEIMTLKVLKYTLNERLFKSDKKVTNFDVCN